ncbi:MAG: hypothetical protein H0W11_12140 [Gemmatimonadetes bacterium]|nr:hypothetical protein [Gemmatimonadota bacterium]
MALFNRDYDRDYGNRGTTGSGRGYDRGVRGSAQHAWRETKDETSERFGRDYDRGYRGGAGRGYAGGTGGTTGYAGTTGSYGTTGYDRGHGTRGTTGRGYDDYGAGYKSRAQTDTGDPFGDRQSGTPIRMVRQRDEGGWFGWGGGNDYDRNHRYDRGYRGTTYGQDYSSNPMGYEPGYGRGTTGARKVNEYEGQHRHGAGGARGYDRGFRGGATRGYDRGWF